MKVTRSFGSGEVGVRFERRSSILASSGSGSPPGKGEHTIVILLHKENLPAWFAVCWLEIQRVFFRSDEKHRKFALVRQSLSRCDSVDH